MLRRWHTAPLRFRLVVITTALLLFGLFVAGAATASVVRSYMLAQVDSDLAGSAHGVARESVDRLLGMRGQDPVLPSAYYVRVELDNGAGGEIAVRDLVESYGRPQLGDVDPDALQDASDPTTVPGTVAGTAWRAMDVVLVDPRTDEQVGVVTMAVPLYPMYATLENVQVAIVLTAVAVAAVGAGIALVLVRRELRPLQEIERTAEAIAAGDLSRRVHTDLPATTEVGSVARSLNAMLAQIEQAFAERSASEARMRRFVSDASHELRTPLATVRGYGELYRMGGVPTEQLPDAMARIEAEAKRMGLLVEDLLQLARLDEGRGMEITEVDLRAVARDAVADLRVLDPDRPARVIGLDDDAPADEPVTVLADDGRLHQVVSNLVGNVLQHTPPGTPVEIAVGPHPAEPEWALLQVRDHGPGIPPEHADRVFERFYRLDRSRNRSSGGSGLGLAIVAAVVGSLGGAVRVRETPGGGTTVEIALRRPTIAGP